MRLVDADTILKADENSDKALVLGSGKSLEIAYALLKKKVEDAPTVDAVVVTRCKDCKYSCKDETGRTCEGYWYELSEFAVSVEDDDFCSYGKRKPSADG